MKQQMNIIRKFNITSKYRGYYLVMDAIEIAYKNQNQCMHITKDIYPILAGKHNVSSRSVEKNIHTIVEKCWENNRELLQEIAGCKLHGCPTNSEFIDYISYYILKENSKK